MKVAHDRLILCFFVLAMAVVAVIATGCTYSGPYVPPPPSIQNPTLYPDAKQVMTKTIEFWKDIPAQEVTFITNSEPAEVFAFYEDVLVEEGWTVNYDTYPNSLNFQGPVGCPSYAYDVIAFKQTGGVTKIQLLPYLAMCECAVDTRQ